MGFWEVRLSEQATEELILAALCGFQVKWKQERFGILFGKAEGDALYVLQAIRYRGGTRTRTRVSVNVVPYARRVRELRSELGLRYLGEYHSHPEVAGWTSPALSEADKIATLPGFNPAIEMIVTVEKNDADPIEDPDYCTGSYKGHYFEIASYRRDLDEEEPLLVQTRSRHPGAKQPW